MSLIYQLDFFKSEEECQFQALRKQLSDVKVSNDKVRKALFTRHGYLMKKIIQLEEWLKILERNICQRKN